MPIQSMRRVSPQARTRKVKRGDSYIIRIFDAPQGKDGYLGKAIAVEDGTTRQFANAEELWRFLTEEDAPAPAHQGVN